MGEVQRAAWARRVLPPVEPIRSDLWSIPVPVPNSPLRYTSVYALASESGVTLIDAGWDSAESWTALISGLTAIGADVADVQGVLLTHFHSDHSGLARRLRELSGAWIALHTADRDDLARREFRDPAVGVAVQLRRLRHLGASWTEAKRLCDGDARFQRRAAIPLPDRLIAGGEDLRIPGWNLTAAHTPGHTRGHVCFLEERAGLLFSGDHLLPRITPNISADSRPDGDALASFLASLRTVAGLPATEVLPAHEWRFTELDARARELEDHHNRRLAEVHQVLSESPRLTPWELAGRLTWSRPWHEIDGPVLISAANETMAHLVHLLRTGRVSTTCSDVPRYSVVPS